MQNIQSWGNRGAKPHQCVYPTPLSISSIQNANTKNTILPHGMGRSYGDVCLNPNNTLICTTDMNALVNFDSQAGILTCESGVLLSDIQNIIVPHGWMLPVTPGTQLITVGGAIANDVHGKNYDTHGTFGHNVQSLTLARSDGEIIHCSPSKKTDWFSATVGGMGLTGLITHATLTLKPVPSAYLNIESIPQRTLSDFFLLSESSKSSHEYTVAWVNFLSGNGRGIFSRANVCNDGDYHHPQTKKRTVPITPPIPMVNRLTVRPFNALYYTINAFKGNYRQHYTNYLYPLDAINHWNRLYGKQGFYQYQSVIPMHNAIDATQEMLAQIKKHGQGSALSVLKTFSDKPPVGMLSFPMHGVTLALDFPDRGQKTLSLFDRLNDIVAQAEGRIYCAKDACQPNTLFEQGYPRLSEFLKYRDPAFSSALSRRLIGD